MFHILCQISCYIFIVQMYHIKINEIQNMPIIAPVVQMYQIKINENQNMPNIAPVQLYHE